MDDSSFQKINTLHEQLHLKACYLVSNLNKKQSISATDYTEFTEIQFKFFKSLSSLIKECTEALGIIDSLTNLPNKRSFQQILLQEENRIKRHNFTSVIAIADIDNFKEVNDTKGLIAGDLLLIQLAELLKNSLRNFDTVARYSGDKFLLYLPETDIVSAEVILERFRQSIENTKFEIAADTYSRITCSFGLSHIDTDITSSESLSNAFTSLNSAKVSGKNTVASSNN
ncbi:MAG: GGDEF domain-containing protein [Gammaproteobacteria bacterium]|nr:GGDEF domain-containing protein [Gammaproteobacteria bacterium]MBT6552385.1 GGDEF domain-containing protein [Gammaproteobacteria bacterium]MBT6700800.1 GGDEF domain-containing protein [Gammaproteobacteria bacterium]